MAVQTKVCTLMEESGFAFGTGGARVMLTTMTDCVCYGYTYGFLRHPIP